MFGCDERSPVVSHRQGSGKKLFRDVSEMALLSHIPYHRYLPNHSALFCEGCADARQSEEDGSLIGRSEGGCPIRSRIDARGGPATSSSKRSPCRPGTPNRLG